jgi:tRNA G18 (ribose-2'-O)-methylase SpoU
LNFLLLSNPSDPLLDDYRNIPDPELIQRRGIFVAEGRLVVRRLITGHRYPVRSVMVTEPAHAALRDLWPERPDLTVYVVTREVMNAITGFNIHRGCLAIGERGPSADWRSLLSTPCSQRPTPTLPTPKVILLLERIANADNVGGIFRNAAAFGAHAVLLDEPTTDPLYRKAIRTSMGASLVVPFARVTSVPDVVTELRRDGFATVALTPAASATRLESAVSDARGKSVALVLGHEGEGLSEAALSACELHARIATQSAVDSLNVASAAAIGLHEVRRLQDA